jgi:hypothetical protein
VEHRVPALEPGREKKGEKMKYFAMLFLLACTPAAPPPANCAGSGDFYTSWHLCGKNCCPPGFACNSAGDCEWVGTEPYPGGNTAP